MKDANTTPYSFYWYWVADGLDENLSSNRNYQWTTLEVSNAICNGGFDEEDLDFIATKLKPENATGFMSIEIESCKPV
jgi:hypothetical protein